MGNDMLLPYFRDALPTACVPCVPVAQWAFGEFGFRERGESCQFGIGVLGEEGKHEHFCGFRWREVGGLREGFKGGVGARMGRGLGHAHGNFGSIYVWESGGGGSVCFPVVYTGPKGLGLTHG